MSYIIGICLSVMAVFLILLVLVQRGRGGGLSGAFGGVGGSSAFGAKAGDVFTKITIVSASIWIVACVGAAYWAGHRPDPLGNAAAPLGGGPAASEMVDPAATSEEKPSSGAGTSDATAESSSAGSETSSDSSQDKSQ